MLQFLLDPRRAALAAGAPMPSAASLALLPAELAALLLVLPSHAAVAEMRHLFRSMVTQVGGVAPMG